MPSTPWRFTDDVEEFAAHVWDLLATDPAAHTVALTVIEGVRAGRRWSQEPMLFGWSGGSPAVAAVLMTPPHYLHLAHVPESLIEPLVTALGERHVRPPGVNGECALVDRFVSAWTAGGGLATVEMQSRLYVLDRLAPPVPGPPGQARPVRDSEVARAVEWWAAFVEEAGVVSVGVEEAVRDAVGETRLWWWEDAGDAVSLAGRQRTAAGVARVGPVYTPPGQRRRGYGAAVTAAVTAAALREGVDGVVLFTDLANPTSNKIYQDIGYEPVNDVDEYEFG